MKRPSKISNNRALLVLCALGFSCTISTPVAAQGLRNVIIPGDTWVAAENRMIAQKRATRAEAKKKKVEKQQGIISYPTAGAGSDDRFQQLRK